ncbi:AEC family transporter [Clostridium sp. AF37-5AT]|nr:AEC family transporter [Clostridium sp. AM22-16AC]RHO94140.1 AEC family transporter [Clostridium sp. AF37-5AT]
MTLFCFAKIILPFSYIYDIIFINYQTCAIHVLKLFLAISRKDLITMLIVFNQMISLFLLMLTGYLANRFGVIDKTFESKVSRFIVNISLPATILNAVTGSDMPHDQEMLPIFIAAVSIFLVAHVVCHFIQKIIRWNPTYELMLNYSNLGFMGIPIISTLYGGEYVLHVSIFMMTFNLSLFSYGVYLLSRDASENRSISAAAASGKVLSQSPDSASESGQKTSGFSVKKLLSPGILSAFLAIGIYLLDIRLPQHAVSLFSTVGATTTPLAMIVIGSTLAGVKFSTVFTDKELYLFSFLKLLVLPLITFFVLRFFIKDRTLLEISTILSGCPIAGNVSMLCMEHNRDVTLVSKGICISTLLSMISIPVVAALVAVL